MFRFFQENKSISWLVSQKDYIDFSPPYQRMGKIWNKSQKQLLVDSIINGFDIPKLYFHFMPKNDGINHYNYGVIDGKQRLEAIYEFLEDKFPISNDFKFLCDCPSKYNSINGKYFSEIDATEPSITAKLMEYKLSIVFMDTDNPDIINETFLRLNSGISVNTAEKRNATGGPLAEKLKKMYTDLPFFNETITIKDTRYAHFDLAIKFLMLEMGYDDLSKKTVDGFMKEYREFNNEICCEAFKRVINKLQYISQCFNKKDKLLSKKNLIITFFSIVHKIPEGHEKKFLSYFENLRCECMKEENKDNAEEAEALLIDFTLQLRQGADKRASLERRLEIMEKYLHKYLVSALGYQ